MARNGTVDRIESAANITLVISRGSDSGVKYSDGSFGGSDDGDDGNGAGYFQIPISRLDTTKEVEINEVRESSLKASGYSITSISYSGTMMFKGSRFTKRVPDSESDGDGSAPITDFLYDDHGVPQPVSININHELNDEPERYKHVLATSESYEVRSEETTETAFDWVAMDRATDQPE